MRSYPSEVVQALTMSQDRFVWEAPAFPHYERGPRWYITMSALAVILVAYAVWTANFLFAFLILLMAIILILAGNEKPKPTLAQIGDNGIVWNGKLHLFQDLKNFSVVYEPPDAKILYAEAKSALSPRLRIPLEEQDPVTLREHLRQFMTEDLDLRDEHLSDIVARLLRI